MARLGSIARAACLGLALVTGCSLAHGAAENDAGVDAVVRDAGPGALPDAEVLDASPRDAALGTACDSLDPCVIATSAGASCLAVAAPDGTLCDDGDGCTLGDRCVAGHCAAGARSTGPAEVVSFATAAFAGLALGISSERFVFFQPTEGGTTAVLARRDGSALEPVSQLDLPGTSVSAAYSLGEQGIAYVSRHRAGLLAVVSDALVARGELDLGLTASARHFAALGPRRLLVCTDDLFGAADLRVIDVASPDLLTERAAIAIEGGCRALATTSDGAHAIVAAGADTLLVDAEGQTLRSLGRASESVHARSGRLVLLTSGGLALVRESDGVTLATRSVRAVAARTTSRGLETIEERDAAGGGVDRVLVVHAISDDVPARLTLLSEEQVAHAASAASAPSRWASADDALLDGTRLFALRDRPPFLEEVRDPRRFWPFWMRASGTTLLLRDDAAAVAMDLSDPHRPRAIAGGELDVPTFALTLEIPTSGEVGLYGQRSFWPSRPAQAPRSITLAGASATLAAVDYDDAQVPTERARHPAPEGTTRIDVTYRHLYALGPGTSAGTWRVRRWPAEAWQGSVVPEASLDLAIGSPSAAIADLGTQHDDGAMAAWESPEATASRVSWWPLAEGATPTAPLALDFFLLDAAVSGDRLVALGAHAGEDGSTLLVHDVVVVFAERRGGALVETQRASWPTAPFSRLSAFDPTRIVRFDGEVAYLQLPHGTPESPVAALVAVRGETEADRVAYPVVPHVPLWSMTESDVGLVAGGPGGVVVVRPLCR